MRGQATQSLSARFFYDMSNQLTSRQKQNRRGLVLLALLTLVLAAGALTEWRYLGPLPVAFGTDPDAPASLARWPWRETSFDRPHSGVAHWFDRSSPDGTQVDLFDFDFAANPHLRFGLYDQDEDDARPFDDKAHPWAMSVAQAAKHLNATGRGEILAACNGLFYDYDETGPDATASHVTPIVLNGTPRYTQVENHRWTFGVKYDQQGRPTFQAIHLPNKAVLAREFTFAAGGGAVPDQNWRRSAAAALCDWEQRTPRVCVYENQSYFLGMVTGQPTSVSVVRQRAG